MLFNHNYVFPVPSMRPQVDEDEWQARVDLAILYRAIQYFRLTDTIYTHISMRVPGRDQFLINPYGLLYDEISASSLVKVDANGEIISDPTGMGINKAGFVIHSAVHKARHDIACVIHTHTRAGIGVAAQEHGLLPISQHAALLAGRVGYHDYEGVAFDMDEQARLVRDLGEHYLLVLRNHGLLSAGRTPGQALFLMLTIERACEAQIAALSGGAPVRMIGQDAIDQSLEAVDQTDFDRDWAAMTRLMERIAPDYRT